MTTYSIYFENQSEKTHNYGFFLEEPKATSNVGNPTVYSNVLLSQSVADDGNWTIDITNNYYAWSGKAAATLKPGIVVSTGNGKLATLGTSTTPGSTWHMYNNGGTPGFLPNPTHTSAPGAFEVDTITDFTPSQNFLVGLGAVDMNGRMKPAAVFEADPNSVVQISPVAKFFLARYNSAVGTVISTSSYSKSAAIIDFQKAGGNTSCTVIQNPKGEFSVNFYAQSAFVEEVNRLKAVGRSSDKNYQKLLQGIKSLLQPGVGGDTTVPAAGGDPAFPAVVMYVFSLDWVDPGPADPLTQPIKDKIYEVLTEGLQAEGYFYFTDKSPGNNLQLWFSGRPKDMQDVALDWGNTVERLGKDKRFVTMTLCWLAPTNSQDQSIAVKKQKALTFLQNEGLLTANGVQNGVTA